MYSADKLLLENSSVTGNTCADTGTGTGDGGGVYVVSYLPGGAIIRNTTISRNSADSGGGVWLNSVTGSVLIQNSTITNNTATSTLTETGYGGGGIAARAQFVPPSGTVLTLQSTIVAGNVQTAGTVRRPDLSIRPGSLISVTADHSLIGVLDAGVLTSGSGTDIFGTAAAPLDPLLGSVGLPLPGSPAIDRGSNPANLATDQAGNPRVNGFAADIGAVEGVSSGLPVAVAASIPAVTVSGGTSNSSPSPIKAARRSPSVLSTVTTSSSPDRAASVHRRVWSASITRRTARHGRRPTALFRPAGSGVRPTTGRISSPLNPTRWLTPTATRFRQTRSGHSRR